MSQSIRPGLPEHLHARQQAQRGERLVQVIAMTLFVLCFAAAGMFLGPLNRIRKEQQLLIDPTTVKGLPPDLALMGKLGTFRALAIDWAAIRGEKLKEDGKFYEAYELYRTVCRLQPRFPTAWSNASWNMAYNISVTQYTPEARWRWVNDGIKILRDEGIQWNPRSVYLYWQLAWTYWHKIADYLDDEHYNYKRALAVEMESVVGAFPITLTTEEYFAWFEKIVDAPRDLDALLASDAEVQRVAFMLEQAGLPPDRTLLQFVAQYDRPELTIRELQVDGQAESDQRIQRPLGIIQDEKNAKAVDRLLAAIRSHVLRTDYRFDLDYLYKLMREHYGPLDLRNAFTHSLYWASLGNELAKDKKYQDSAASMNNARLILFSLRDLIARGRISLHPNFDDPFKSYIEFSPDARYIPYAFREYPRLAEEQWGDDADWDPEVGIAGTSYWVGFVAGIENWIQLLYFEGGEQNLALAEQFYLYLRKNNPEPDGSVQERYQKTVEEFAMSTVLDQLATFRQSRVIVRSLLFESLKYLSLGRNREAARALQRAQKCHEYWMADTKLDINERRKMPELRVMLRDSVEDFMLSPQFTPYAKACLWHKLDLQYQQLTYDRLLPYFTQLCAAQQPPWSVARSFPEPPGMEQVRDRDPDYRPVNPADTADQGTRYKD